MTKEKSKQEKDANIAALIFLFPIFFIIIWGIIEIPIPRFRGSLVKIERIKGIDDLSVELTNGTDTKTFRINYLEDLDVVFKVKTDYVVFYKPFLRHYVVRSVESLNNRRVYR